MITQLKLIISIALSTAFSAFALFLPSNDFEEKLFSKQKEVQAEMHSIITYKVENSNAAQTRLTGSLTLGLDSIVTGILSVLQSLLFR